MPDPIAQNVRPPTRPSSELEPDSEFWGESRARTAVPPRPQISTGMDALRDRFQEWRADARIGVLALVVIAVIAGVVWYRVGVSGGNEPVADSGSRTSATQQEARATTPTTTADVVVVHVAGAVTTPGVVELPTGSRVIDAIEAAGGGVADADFDRLNLAAKLTDGQRVLVPKVGQLVALDAQSGTPQDGTTQGGLINLNSATAAQLEDLPGIGPTLAAAIISERDRRGGFKSINELRDVRGIGEKRFADLRDHVTV